MKRQITRSHIIFFSALTIAVLPFLGFPRSGQITLTLLLALVIIIVSAFGLYQGILWDKSWIVKVIEKLKEKRKSRILKDTGSVDNQKESKDIQQKL